jgi:hypothetical protein
VVTPYTLLAVDPGAKPGFAYYQDGALVQAGWKPDAFQLDGWTECVFEAQHSAAALYRNGRRVRIARKSQSTLSFTAGRLFERFKSPNKYRIMPDDWRAILWPGARRLPKAVVLARLEVEFGDLVPADVSKTHRGDVLEAIAIGQAWLRLSASQKEKFRVE